MTLKNLYDAIGASYDDTIERLMSAGQHGGGLPGSTHPQGRVRQPGLHPAPGNRRTADGAAARRDPGGHGALVFKAQ